METLFSDSDIRLQVRDNDSVERTWNIGKAFAEWLPDEGSVAVVKRPATETSLSSAFIEGLLLQGRTVVDAGTIADEELQAVYASINESKMAGAAVLDFASAQGTVIISLFDSFGVVVSSETGLGEISDLVDAGNFLPAPQKGRLTFYSNTTNS